MNTPDSAVDTQENHDLEALKALLADPDLEHDLNRLGHSIHGRDITDHIEDYYLDRPDLIAAVRQAFEKMRDTIRAQDVRNTGVIDQTSQVRAALKKIGF